MTRMKKLLRFSTGYAPLSCICAASLALTGCATKGRMESGASPSAKVVSMKGGARYVTGGKAWHMVKVGDTIKQGVVIQTADKSEVGLVLNDGLRSQPRGSQQNTLRLYENSLLAIDKLAREQSGTNVTTDTQLNLRGGRMYGTVPTLRGASRYEVQLPNGVAGTRGATFEMSAEGVVRTISGSVVLAYVRPDRTVETQLVAGLQQFDARSQQLTPGLEPTHAPLTAGSP